MQDPLQVGALDEPDAQQGPTALTTGMEVQIQGDPAAQLQSDVSASATSTSMSSATNTANTPTLDHHPMHVKKPVSASSSPLRSASSALSASISSAFTLLDPTLPYVNVASKRNDSTKEKDRIQKESEKVAVVAAANPVAVSNTSQIDLQKHPIFINRRQSENSISVSRDAVAVLKSGSPSSSHFHAPANALAVDNVAEQLAPQIYQTIPAPKKRNQEWHDLFPNIDAEEVLLDEWSCAWQREVLIQGRMYLSSSHLCFNANIFGWSHSVTLDFNDIISIEKKSIGGFIPNSIEISTIVGQQHYFASFLQRDNAYDAITRQWGNTSKAIKMQTFSKQNNRSREEEDAISSSTSSITDVAPKSNATSKDTSPEKPANESETAKMFQGEIVKQRNSLDTIGTWSMSMFRGGVSAPQMTPTIKSSGETAENTDSNTNSKSQESPLVANLEAVSEASGVDTAETTTEEPAYLALMASMNRRESRGLVELVPPTSSSTPAGSITSSPTSSHHPSEDIYGSTAGIVHQKHVVTLPSQTHLPPITPPAAPTLTPHESHLDSGVAEYSPPDSPVIDLTPHLAGIAKRKAIQQANQMQALQAAFTPDIKPSNSTPSLPTRPINKVTVLSSSDVDLNSSPALASSPNLSPTNNRVTSSPSSPSPTAKSNNSNHLPPLPSSPTPVPQKLKPAAKSEAPLTQSITTPSIQGQKPPEPHATSKPKKKATGPASCTCKVETWNAIHTATFPALSLGDIWEAFYSSSDSKMRRYLEGPIRACKSVRGTAWKQGDTFPAFTVNSVPDETLYESGTETKPVEIVSYVDAKAGLERRTENITPLSNPLGPKSTRCFVRENVHSFELDDSLCISQSTVTPDVPSGTCFMSHVRICWTRSSQNAGVSMRVTCLVEFVKSSWIQAIIHAAVLDGLKTHYKDLEAFINSNVQPSKPVAETESSTIATPASSAQDGQSHPLEDELEEMELQSRQKRKQQMVELLSLESSKTGKEWRRDKLVGNGIGSSSERIRQSLEEAEGQFYEIWQGLIALGRVMQRNPIATFVVIFTVLLMQIIVCICVMWVFGNLGGRVVDERIILHIAQNAIADAFKAVPHVIEEGRGGML
ncbi:hypothetical protein HDU77_010920 [Chytriomyces hyalinus]|nr:hypothetical protein HDU77_010920 [Chytriomyces hyalinus]